MARRPGRFPVDPIRGGGRAVLRVQVVSGAYADDVIRRLREHDNTGLLAVRW